MSPSNLGVDRLQQIVDALGTRLKRSVLVDDHMLNLVAVGQDFGDSDPARVWSLLNRRTRPEDVDYAHLRSAVDPIWIEPNDELSLHARLCVPVRLESALLGFMWLIDRDRTLTEAEVEDAVHACSDIAVVLRQRLMIADRDTAFVSYLVEELMHPDLARSGQAATDLKLHGYVVDDAHVGVIIIASAADAPAGTGMTSLSEVVRTASRALPPGSWISSVSGRRATLLLARPRPVDDLLTEMGDRLSAGLKGQPGSWWVAIGGVTQGLGGAATSHFQATTALSVGRRLAEADDGGQVSWAELGAYGLLGQLPEGILRDETLPLGLFALLRSGNAAYLLDTIEMFLDCAGDKQRTARELDIHRTTLYYRLDRIEAITGMSLADGANRLVLHLAVKLFRLRGVTG